MSNSAPCIKPTTDNTWKWGLGGGSAWLQYGNAERQFFTLQRSPSLEAGQMLLHDASAAVSKTQEVPGFIPFSFEGGFHTGRENDIVAVEGVALLNALQTGEVGLFSGNLNFPSKEIKLLRKVGKAIKGSFRIYASDTCYEIPLSSEPHKVMNTLLANQKQFNEEAVKLFLK